MGIIDDKVRAYWAAGDRNAQNAAAYAIRKACRHFLESSPSLLSSINDEVRDLETEAEAELTAHQPGWTGFAAKKAQGAAHNLKPLAPGYAHERRQYLAEGKERNPISASALRDTALADALPGTVGHTLITNMDDQTSDGYARPGGVMRAGGAQNEVLFFDKRERLEHMLVEPPQDGWSGPGMDRCSLHLKGSRICTQWTGTEICLPRTTLSGPLNSITHHLMPAARLYRRNDRLRTNGRLYFIDNNSGRCRPRAPTSTVASESCRMPASSCPPSARLADGRGGDQRRCPRRCE